MIKAKENFCLSLFTNIIFFTTYVKGAMSPILSITFFTLYFFAFGRGKIYAQALGKVRFLLEGRGGGGGAGIRGGRVISKVFTNLGRLNLFARSRRRVNTFFGKEKITPCRFY